MSVFFHPTLLEGAARRGDPLIFKKFSLHAAQDKPCKASPCEVGLALALLYVQNRVSESHAPPWLGWKFSGVRARLCHAARILSDRAG